MAALIALLAGLAAVQATTPHQARHYASQNATSNLTYITLEEHVVPAALKGFATAQLANTILDPAYQPELLFKLSDANTTRLSDLNENAIRVQVLSNININFTDASVCAENNDLVLSDWIKPHPNRYAGLCVLAMGEPDAAAAELERCITEMGFVGGFTTAFLSNGSSYIYYDSPKFWPVFETAQRLDVPIYIHPAFAPLSQVLLPGGQFAPAVGPDGTQTFSIAAAVELASAAFGFESGAGVGFLRLYAAGMFDKYPDVKIILGHVGEFIPYILERAQYFLDPVVNTTRTLEEVWRKNVWVTTSGYFSLSQVPTLLATTPVEHIMYSVDYPFNYNYQGTRFMAALRASGLVTEEEWQAITHGNAERLLKLA